MNKYLFRQEREDWNLNAAFYATETKSPLQEILNQAKLATYSLSAQDKSILDLGAGIGSFANELQMLGKNVVAVDFSPEMAKIAKLKFPDLDYKIASANSLPFPNQTFDVVIADGILHHLKIQGIFSDTLSEIKRVLKKDGHFCFLDRNGSICSNLLLSSFMLVKRLIEKVKGPFPTASTRYEVPFNDHDLDMILKAGFELIERKFISSAPFFLLVTTTNTLQYFTTESIAFQTQTALTPLAKLFEKSIKCKFLTVEQCVKLKKAS